DCGLPSRIHILYLIYSIHSTFTLVQIAVNLAKTGVYGFGGRIAQRWCTANSRTPMPQEISVSYQAIKSKVYRLIDSLVVGEKSEVEVQESVRRWWALIHPADRPIAQKYLLMVLGRSASALDSMGDAFLSVSSCEVARPQMTEATLPAKRMRLLERMVKETSVRTAV